MPRVQQTLPDGAVIHGRYRIKEILGTGGFSAVYLVQDLQGGNEAAAGEFALKQLTDEDRQRRAHFTFEGEVLMRLQHPALPRIHRVFEDEGSGRTCLLMEYIAGSNLEILRTQQTQGRFPLSRALSIMAPVVDAVAYLHRQVPPIIHRDVKPANIIVPAGEQGAVLIDFGIAKEYNLDSTTTAVRLCSPGYGALEQYSTGTDLRTDIYALGATFYALLSGEVPVDALSRATKIAIARRDPLVQVQKLAPSIPSHVADAIHLAMSINSDKRFATVGEFWKALQGPVDQEPGAEQVVPYVRPEEAPGRDKEERALPPAKGMARPKKLSMLALLMGTLFIALSSGAGLWAYTSIHGPRSVGSIPVHPHAVPALTPKLSPTGSTTNTLPRLASSYKGTVYNLLTRAGNKVYVQHLRQISTSISGDFAAGATQGLLSGLLDTSRHIFFTVATKTGSLFFEGTVHSDGNLAGNYCRENEGGQCLGDYGLWSMTPVY